MTRLVDPLEVFNLLVGGTNQTGSGAVSEAEAKKRLARSKSVLDAVLENARRTRSLLGGSDQKRMDEFLASVRAVEQRAINVSSGMGCSGALRPDPIGIDVSGNPRQTTEQYDKGTHADAMNGLITMAFQCDATRIVSYMLEDERSEFTYNHVKERAFTDAAASSTEKAGDAVCPEYHSAQHAGGDPFASITWWNVSKVADLCRSLDAIEEAPGISVLDNTVVHFGACMHGGNHLAEGLPVALVGGGNLGLKTDQHLVLDARPLRDLYVTLMNDVYGLSVTDFGQNKRGTPLSKISELLMG